MPRRMRSALRPLGAIFELCGLGGLPLHVAGRVGAACAQRHYVVNHVPRAWAARLPRGRAWLLALELGASLTGAVSCG